MISRAGLPWSCFGILILLSCRLSAGDATTAADTGRETLFSTFSLCAVDPHSGECGVAVTTRVPFVGRAVPWVEAGVGAVATQSWTRVEYGHEGLALLKQGLSPKEALDRMLAPDKGRDRRQVGLINMKGETAAFTGSECGDWAGSRQGENYTVQANIMVGPQVIQAVADHFEKTAGSGMPLAERMILAMEAGQKTGGDKRWGLLQSAALKIADPSVAGRGNDHISLEIRVDEHPQPLQEMKRIYYLSSRRLGYREFSQIEGEDVVELKRMLHTLGYLRKDLTTFPEEPRWEIEAALQDENPTLYRQQVDAYRQARRAYFAEFGRFDEEAVTAVDAFRKDRQMDYTGNPAGLVDRALVEALKAAYYAKTK